MASNGGLKGIITERTVPKDAVKATTVRTVSTTVMAEDVPIGVSLNSYGTGEVTTAAATDSETTAAVTVFMVPETESPDVKVTDTIVEGILTRGIMTTSYQANGVLLISAVTQADVADSVKVIDS